LREIGVESAGPGQRKGDLKGILNLKGILKGNSSAPLPQGFTDHSMTGKPH
jgi:hypothetical protein